MRKKLRDAGKEINALSRKAGWGDEFEVVSLTVQPERDQIMLARRERRDLYANPEEWFLR